LKNWFISNIARQWIEPPRATVVQGRIGQAITHHKQGKKRTKEVATCRLFYENPNTEQKVENKCNNHKK
jgi:hypothetical protein